MTKSSKNLQDEELEDFDLYTIREDWNALTGLIEKMNPDLERFLKKRGKKASVRFRNNLSKIRDLSIRLREGVLFQRRDNHTEFF